MAEPEKGDWVRVWALVTDADPHPEEYTVRLESHNEHYTGLVRRDQVIYDGTYPEGLPRCDSMYCFSTDVQYGELFLRCIHQEGHSKTHQSYHRLSTSGESVLLEWEDKDSTGYIEQG